ncbi:hypothetical protein [Parathermosynechococcus lividus]|nr:hypothetical protein [Synechococcus sp. PCC 6716]
MRMHGESLGHASNFLRYRQLASLGNPSCPKSLAYDTTGIVAALLPKETDHVYCCYMTGLA